MDIALTRILSLIPKKEDGSFVHGSKKAFAKSIGYDSGDIISMWINGSSSSYKGKIHEIAVKYNVSVEWLRGETDEKKPANGETSGLSEEAIELLSLFDHGSPEYQADLLGYARGRAAARKSQDTVKGGK